MIDYDQTILNNILISLKDEDDKLNSVLNTIKNTGNNGSALSSINKVISDNTNIINFMNYCMNLYSEYLNNGETNYGQFNQSITELSLFSRDLSGLVLYKGHNAGYYFAQTDPRWKWVRYSTKYDNFIGGAGCKSLATVNSLANLGFYDTFKNSDDPETALVMSISAYINNNSDDPLKIINYLNKKRVENGLQPVVVKNFGNEFENHFAGYQSMLEQTHALEIGESGIVTFTGGKSNYIYDINGNKVSGTDSFVKRIEYLEANKEEGVSYQYSVVRVIANPGGLLSSEYGHYVSINGFEFDNTGHISNIYVHDSDIRGFSTIQVNIDEYNANSNLTTYNTGITKRVSIGGYPIAEGGLKPVDAMEIVTPGILKIPTEHIDDAKFGSGFLIVTKVENTVTKPSISTEEINGMISNNVQENLIAAANNTSENINVWGEDFFTSKPNLESTPSVTNQTASVSTTQSINGNFDNESVPGPIPTPSNSTVNINGDLSSPASPVPNPPPNPSATPSPDSYATVATNNQSVNGNAETTVSASMVTPKPSLHTESEIPSNSEIVSDSVSTSTIQPVNDNFDNESVPGPIPTPSNSTVNMNGDLSSPELISTDIHKEAAFGDKYITSRKSNKSNIAIAITATVGVVSLIVGVVSTVNKDNISSVNNDYSIVLTGDNNIYLSQGENYQELGYKIIDNDGNSISSNVSINNNVNSSALGTYEVSYTYENAKINRYVKVLEKESDEDYNTFKFVLDNRNASINYEDSLSNSFTNINQARIDYDIEDVTDVKYCIYIYGDNRCNPNINIKNGELVNNLNYGINVIRFIKNINGKLVLGERFINLK